jgi:DNA-binding MarR family transcriptional regulator
MVNRKLRWLKKREFVIYAHLALRHGGTAVSATDLVYEVKKTFGTTIRTAKNIVKRLMRAGYIVKVDANNVRVRTLDDSLTELVTSYVSKRRGRRKVNLANRS